jgi:hypothetical protein
MTTRRPSALALPLAAALLSSTACDWLEDRLKTCEDVRTDLVNGYPTFGPIHIAGPDEPFSEATYLLPGASRRITVCLERGDRKKFRAAQADQETVDVVHCVALRATYEDEVLRVFWNGRGLACVGW